MNGPGSGACVLTNGMLCARGGACTAEVGMKVVAGGWGGGPKGLVARPTTGWPALGMLAIGGKGLMLAVGGVGPMLKRGGPMGTWPITR